jgi:hypothetical protein
MTLLHNEGGYKDHPPAGSPAGPLNLYNPCRGSLSSALTPVANPQVDPAAFNRQIRAGRININHTENCQACELRPNKFYCQRPPHPNTHKEDFTLVRVVRVIMDPDHPTVQWGAFVEFWELATLGADDCSFFEDPWWMSARHGSNQHYNDKLSVFRQTWCYETSELSDFQDEVAMAEWTKPKNWNKTYSMPMNQVRGITRKRVSKSNRTVQKLQTYCQRWYAEDNQ